MFTQTQRRDLERAWTGRRRQHRKVPELLQNQAIYVLIDKGAGLDSSGNSLVGLTDRPERYLDLPAR